MNNTNNDYFNFRIIDMPDGSQIIDNSIKTPFNSLTLQKYMEYVDIDNKLFFINRMKKKQQKEAERKRKFTYKLLHKVACMCGIM